MSTAGVRKSAAKTYKKVKTILVSQPKPERSPYYKLETKYDLQIDWRPFIHVEGITEKEFRKQRIRPDEFPCIILTSRNAIQHLFRLCNEMRIEMPKETRYFCQSAAVANYLHKFITYRKRKVFVGTRMIQDLESSLLKYKDQHFLIPSNDTGSTQIGKYLKKLKIKHTESSMYKTVSSDLSDLSDITYDVLVFFSPLGIKSLYDNFPDFKQNDTRIAIYGSKTQKAVEEHGLDINILAPAPNVPSMTMALENYLKLSNK